MCSLLRGPTNYCIELIAYWTRKLNFTHCFRYITIFPMIDEKMRQNSESLKQAYQTYIIKNEAQTIRNVRIKCFLETS